MLESEAWQVYIIIVTPIDDVEKLPCMTNDRSNSMPLNQRLFHKPHILARFTLHFRLPPIWNGGSLPNTPKNTRTIKLNSSELIAYILHCWIRSRVYSSRHQFERPIAERCSLCNVLPVVCIIKANEMRGIRGQG